MRFTVTVASLLGCASAAIVWDGRFNDLTSSTDLNKWSWSSQVGPYQYYIHGPSAVTSYVNLSPSYKNPADSGSSKGAKITLDNTAYWNGQTMRRTELIPQVSNPSSLTSGKLFYHFSISRSNTNAPNFYREHQIAFFESHFTELKTGANSGQPGPDSTLRWVVNQQTKHSVTWAAGTWYNYAYEINFSANTVALWYSTGSSPLVLTVPAVSVSTSSNGADWHLGVLELPTSGQSDSNEDYFFSGVYIENGSITTSVAGPGGVVVNPPASSTSKTTTKAATTASTKTTAVVTTKTTAVVTTKTTAVVQTTAKTTTAASSGGGTSTPWGQCGGEGYTGPKLCPSGWTCKYSNAWYSQCLQ